MEKAKGELLKVRKKSQRKKPTEKYEEKEKQVQYFLLMINLVFKGDVWFLTEVRLLVRSLTNT